jgi:predicted lipase
LGGAVANVAAASYKRQFPNAAVSLYTFGQPRVGNREYADYLDRKLSTNFRVVHQKDIVTHEPAHFTGYCHSGTEIWYKNGMYDSY